VVEYSYTKSKNLKEFIEKIPKWGVPEKIDTKFVKSMNYTSSNDFTIPSILKFIGFLDSSGVPTQIYKDYKMKSDRSRVLGQALLKSYAPLFKQYPNAQNEKREILKAFFTAYTEKGEDVINRTTTTFLTLCELASFKGVPPPKGGTAPEEDLQEQVKSRRVQYQPAININIQFVLPEDKDPAVYDKIFASLKKHLLEWEKDE